MEVLKRQIYQVVNKQFLNGCSDYKSFGCSKKISLQTAVLAKV